jgi:diguanylate cyclase (GGDEF)-like protein/PAS domain S-box-containing protein
MAVTNHRLTLLAAATLAFAAVFASWLVLKPFGGTATVAVSDLGTAVPASAATVLAFLASIRSSGRPRAAWALVGSGLAMWAFAEATWSTYELLLDRETPFPSMADVGYLGAIPLVCAGIVLLASPSRLLARTRTALDAVAIVFALTVLVWHGILLPTYSDSEATAIEKIIGGAYPLGDLVLFFGLLVVLSNNRRGRAGAVVAVFAAGLGLFTLADLAFAYLELNEGYSSGSVVDFGWTFGYLLMGYAAALHAEWRPGYAVQLEERRPAPVWRQAMPLGLVAAMFGFLVAVGSRASLVQDVPSLVIAGIVLTAVLARQIVVLYDNAALQAALASAGELLEAKVQGRTAALAGANKRLRLEIAGRNRAEQTLSESEEKYRDLVENISEVIYSLDREGRVVYVSPVVKELGGYDPADVVGRSFVEFIHPDDLPSLAESYQRTVSGRLEPSEFRILTKSGEFRWVRTSSRPALDGERIVGLRAVLMDITERRLAENRIQYLAHHDGLTGLPNRTLLADRLTMALAERRRDGNKLAVMFLDLDRFKLVNDTAGHLVGDRVLQGVAERLTTIVREGDTVARLGGDEFTVLLPAVSCLKEAREVADRILERLRRPWVLAGHEFHVAASMGIAMYPEDGQDGETLLRSADTAMYHAKDLGRDNLQVFTAAMDAHVQNRVRLEQSLRQALQREEFAVYYQPQVSTDTGRIVGMEALVRWRHPERGIVYPDEFIPVAEETGLILPLGEWVLRTACAQNKAFQEIGLAPLRVAVNLSSRQFQDVGLVSLVASVLKETGLSPHHLELEITEGTAMRDMEFTVKVLNELRGMGISVSIDDFGTGYSSLAYMKTLPVDAVKIDRCFVQDATVNSSDAAIVGSILVLARTLGLRVVAEGVETREQLTVLNGHQCREAQGYLFGEAVPAKVFQEMLAKGQALGVIPKGRPRRAA